MKKECNLGTFPRSLVCLHHEVKKMSKNVGFSFIRGYLANTHIQRFAIALFLEHCASSNTAALPTKPFSNLQKLSLFIKLEIIDR